MVVCSANCQKPLSQHSCHWTIRMQSCWNLLVRSNGAGHRTGSDSAAFPDKPLFATRWSPNTHLFVVHTAQGEFKSIHGSCTDAELQQLGMKPGRTG